MGLTWHQDLLGEKGMEVSSWKTCPHQTYASPTLLYNKESAQWGPCGHTEASSSQQAKEEWDAEWFEQTFPYIYFFVVVRSPSFYKWV